MTEKDLRPGQLYRIKNTNSLYEFYGVTADKRLRFKNVTVRGKSKMVEFNQGVLALLEEA